MYSNYLKSRKFLLKNVNFEDVETEKKKIYPTDNDKKDKLEVDIKAEINREFHILLQKDKFSESDALKVKEFIKDYIKKEKIFFQDVKDYENFVDMIVNDIFGLGVLEQYINDPSITEIWVLGSKRIYVEQNGKRRETSLKFKNDKVIVTMINKILAPIDGKIDESRPRVDAYLPDGSRVAATIPPISRCPEIVIRKFMKEKMKLDAYTAFGSATQRMVEFMRESVAWGANILVVGGTSSGKTTFLNALSNEIDPSEHIITIEDTFELMIFSDFLQAWQTKKPNSEGRGEVTFSDLVKHSLRNSPDRIEVGEIRDAVAYDMLQAAITGHKGIMGTIHSDNAKLAVDRFSTLAGSANIITASDAKKLFADAFDLICVLERVEDPKTHTTRRMISQICHVVGYGPSAASILGVKPVEDPEHVYLKDIYKLDKTNLTFITTGYVPKELIKKANMEGKDYDLSLFKPDKK